MPDRGGAPGRIARACFGGRVFPDPSMDCLTSPFITRFVSDNAYPVSLRRLTAQILPEYDRGTTLPVLA